MKQRVFPVSFNASLSVAFIMLLATIALLKFYQPMPVEIAPYLLSVPDQLEKWDSYLSFAADKPFNIQGLDTELFKDYRKNNNNDDDDKVSLYVGYLNSQGKNKELINYRLEWLYENAQKTEVSLSEDISVKINETSFKSGDDLIIAHYWYDLKGRIVADNVQAKMLTIYDGLIEKRTNGAIIIVYTRTRDKKDKQAIRDNQVEFIQSYFSNISRQLP